MNKKIIMLFNFLKKIGVTKAEVNFGIWDEDIDYEDHDITTENGSPVPIPPPFNKLPEEIIYEYMDEICEDVNSDDTGFRNVYMTFDLENYKINMEIFIRYYNTESDSMSYTLENYDEWYKIVNDVFDELNYDGEIILSYEGGGGSGSIMSDMELGNEGRVMSIDQRLLDIGGELLDEYFRGWVYEEGSQGLIHFNREEVWADHNWNRERERKSRNNIVISAI
jgi:hypothetical protein